MLAKIPGGTKKTPYFVRVDANKSVFTLASNANEAVANVAHTLGWNASAVTKSQLMEAIVGKAPALFKDDDLPKPPDQQQTVTTERGNQRVVTDLSSDEGP